MGHVAVQVMILGAVEAAMHREERQIALQKMVY